MIGAAATLTANWITARSQQKVETSKQSAANTEVRRSACAEYLATLYALQDNMREVIRICRNVREEQQVEDSYQEYLTTWKALHEKCAPVVLAGPAALADLANDARQKIAEPAGAVDDVYSAFKRGAQKLHTDKYFIAARGAEEAVNKFATAAMDGLNPRS
ncbi:hypothetical protein [Amycolatopsis sp. NPDC004079]|uniref:hypothetical protein n=1 Tax=Amycolatopsis sp. NPDC004079 TaxID=3154549 RepID=UPI0033ACDA44